jgi:hypothetical protein
MARKPANELFFSSASGKQPFVHSGTQTYPPKGVVPFGSLTASGFAYPRELIPTRLGAEGA